MININQRIKNSWLPITVGEWLAATPLIINQLPDDQHLPFLVKLLILFQKEGIDLSEHLDCLVDALVEEKR